jgi:NTP pyrophosphatase (non-canonical NTP hydrolase)
MPESLNPFMQKAIEDVIAERKRQDEKWGEQDHHPAEWLAILGEEVGEVCRAVCEAHFGGYESTGNWTQYRKELTHVAAVAIAMIECHDRPKPGTCSVCGCTDDDHTLCSAYIVEETEAADA